MGYAPRFNFSRDNVHEPLYTIVPYFNPWRWKSRVKHTERCIKHLMELGCTVVLVEVAYGERDFVFSNHYLKDVVNECSTQTHVTDHSYIGLRTKDELWLKENIINIGVQSLPFTWKYVMWCDSDVHFVRPNLVGEVIQKLQHYDFLQPFTQARDLNPSYEMLPEDYMHANGISFVQSWLDGTLEENLARGFKVKTSGNYYYGAQRVFPGLVWCCRRSAWDAVGGLFDKAIWGGGDWHMSHALVNLTDSMMHAGLHPHYKSMVSEWHLRCERFIRRNVGVVTGTVFHHWHGKKTSRGYGDKHRILAELQFDPLRHLKRDAAGLYQLNDDGSEEYIRLRDSFRVIANERNEDSIDI